jgi:hypothetical protein
MQLNRSAAMTICGCYPQCTIQKKPHKSAAFNIWKYHPYSGHLHSIYPRHQIRILGMTAVQFDIQAQIVDRVGIL